jgi:hypothetical protein
MCGKNPRMNFLDTGTRVATAATVDAIPTRRPH